MVSVNWEYLPQNAPNISWRFIKTFNTSLFTKYNKCYKILHSSYPKDSFNHIQYTEHTKNKSESYFEPTILYYFDLPKIWVNVSYLEKIEIYDQI